MHTSALHISLYSYAFFHRLDFRWHRFCRINFLFRGDFLGPDEIDSGHCEWLPWYLGVLWVIGTHIENVGSGDSYIRCAERRRLNEMLVPKKKKKKKKLIKTTIFLTMLYENGSFTWTHNDGSYEFGGAITGVICVHKIDRCGNVKANVLSTLLTYCPQYILPVCNTIDQTHQLIDPYWALSA